MLKKCLLLCTLLSAALSAETFEIDGSGVRRNLQLKARDVVKVAGSDCTVEAAGSGDIVELTGSANHLEISASLNGLVVTGSSNQVSVRGPLKQLDVQGTENHITLDCDCTLVQFEGVDNEVQWISRKGRQQPKVERNGINNQFKIH